MGRDPFRERPGPSSRHVAGHGSWCGEVPRGKRVASDVLHWRNSETHGSEEQSRWQAAGRSVWPRRRLRVSPGVSGFRARHSRRQSERTNERITRILKLALEARYGQPFVTERWGRGVYWQWIGYLAPRQSPAKPISSDVSFGCSKFSCRWIPGTGREVRAADRARLRESPAPIPRPFRVAAGLGLAPAAGGAQAPERDGAGTQAACVVKVSCCMPAVGEEEPVRIFGSELPRRRELREALEGAPGTHWAGFQIFYPMNESEVQNATGLELVESVLAVIPRSDSRHEPLHADPTGRAARTSSTAAPPGPSKW